MTGAEVFDGRTAAWSALRASPWGRLRYRLVEHTLARVLLPLPGPLKVLDVGGGDGGDSLPLAASGHQVTIVDVSEPLLAMAASAAAAAGLSGLVRVVQADLQDLPAVVDGSRHPFDVVLCHNVLHYRDDLDADVARLRSTLRRGGLLSVMSPNPVMDVLSAAVRGCDPGAAAEVLDRPTIRNVTFDHEVRRLGVQVVEASLRRAGLDVDHRFGIRCVMDLIADDARKADPAFYADVERLELLVCDREPYWRSGRFWQLVARSG